MHRRRLLGDLVDFDSGSAETSILIPDERTAGANRTAEEACSRRPKSVLRASGPRKQQWRGSICGLLDLVRDNVPSSKSD